MKRTYVVKTIYHIYLAIIHALRESEKPEEDCGENLLFIVESTPMIERLIPNLKKRFFRDVHIISRREEHIKALGKLNYALRRRKKLIPYLENKHPILNTEKDFIHDSQLYLCDSDSSKSYFLYTYAKKGINMIEDGAKTYNQRKKSFESTVKSHITKTPLGGGFDPEIIHLYAQFPERLPKALHKKAKELNIAKEVTKFDKLLKNELFELFLPKDSFKIEGNNLALILTQPISEDGLVINEKVKIAIYQDIITKVPPHLKVVLKTHPRERTSYEIHFKDIMVLPALFPIEILSLKNGFHFKEGYTLFSTALSNLEIVENRYFVGKVYVDKFTSKTARDLIMNTSIHT